MEGVMDPLVRQLLTGIGGYDLCVSEFMRVTHQLLPDHVFFRLCPELQQGGATLHGTPVHFQLLGGDPVCLADNAAKAVCLGAPGVDLNFGCPAKTVNRHDGGATLLQYPTRIFNIVSEVRRTLPLDTPLSVKIRLGYNDTHQLIETVQAIESAGAQWITLHTRTKADGYRPPARWEWLRTVKEQIQIPLVANGDIWSVADFKECQALSGCEDYMLGRGAFAQPDLALQISQKKIAGIRFAMIWCEIRQLIVTHSHMAALSRNETFAIQRGKQWIKHLQRNYPEAVELFQQIRLTQTLTDFLQVLGGGLPLEEELKFAIPPAKA
jgi:tRNA-dihydrouridine synthase C